MARLRAAENERPDRLVADPYASHNLAASAAAGSQWMTMSTQVGVGFFALMADQVAVRIRFLDETLLGVTRAGCGQAVLLGCGMDTRSYRLDWSAGTHAARAAISVDLVALWQGGRADLTGWLSQHTWRPRIHDVREVAADYHRSVPAQLAGATGKGSRAWLATAAFQGVRTP